MRQQQDDRLQDIIENSETLLNRLAGYEQIDSTPEGRMISQLKWLRERAKTGQLSLPVEPVYISTLRYVYTNGELSRLAVNRSEYVRSLELPMDRLMALTREGSYLNKREYTPFTVRLIEKLVSILRGAPRPLSSEEKGSIDELNKLKNDLNNGQIQPPLMTWEGYPNFRKVYRLTRSSLDDLPEGWETCHLVANLIFEGVRPSKWITPAVAEQDCQARGC
jgi:hypothetical protein